jgi:hypothetical protein
MFAFQPVNEDRLSISLKSEVLAPDLHLSRVLPAGRKN